MLELVNDIIEVQKETKLDDEKKWCVYCHTNKLNGKKYFGITSRVPEERWKNGHGYDKTQVYFYNAIKKYTWGGFEHEIVSEGLTEIEAKQLEVDLIALYKTNCRRYNNPTYGYNCTDGGDGTSGHLVSDATKQKIREALLDNYKNTGRKPWNYGIPMTNEQKEKLRQACIGREMSEETRKKLSDANRGKLPKNAGKPMSEKSKRKISESLKGHPVSNELKEKLREIKKGKYLGIESSRFNPVFCLELSEIFWGAKAAGVKYGFNAANIGACCRGERNYASRHPHTNEKLHWLYVYDKEQKDGAIIHGAITLGYITPEMANSYLEKLKQEKEIDVNGTMEEKRSVC